MYDNEGRFRPQMFEEIFTKYDKNGDGGLTYDEIHNMRCGNRVAADVFGVRANLLNPWDQVFLLTLATAHQATTAWFEWSTIWLLLQKNGNVWKEDLRGIYDVGSSIQIYC